MNQTLCPVAIKSAQTPQTPALITDRHTVTYQELDRLIQATGACLRKESFSPFRPIRFTAKKELETIVFLCALFREGLRAFPQSALRPAIEMEFFSSHSLLSTSPLLDLDSPSLFLLTSGTSAEPKIAALSLGNLFASAKGALTSLKVQDGDRWLLSLPLFHVGGLGILLRCFVAGATCVLSSRPIHQALNYFDITHLSLVPTQLYRLLREKSSPFPLLKTVLLGGAPLGEALLNEGLDKGLPIVSSWGMTETASLVTCNGEVLPGREVSIQADGEIFVRGSVLFKGYLNKEEELETPFNKDGWFATKDLGKWNGDRLMSVGRKDKLLTSGGEKIQPEEIGSAL